MSSQSNLFDSTEKLHWPLPGEARLELLHNFLGESIHAELFQRLQNTLHWEQSRIRIAGRAVLIPRLNAWYGDAGRRYRYSGRVFDAIPWSDELAMLRSVIQEECASSFNSVLANLYRDGADSVAWHADDEPELGTNPVIASLSLGATRKFQLKHKRDRSITRIDIDLPDNSLLIMSGSLQHNWIHQIPKTRRPIGPRINLTFRLIMPQ